MHLRFLSFFLLLCSFCTAAPFDNEVFDPAIRTVQFHHTENELRFPILKLKHDAEYLTLEFDELRAAPSDFSATLFHCDADWNVSNLIPVEFYTGFLNAPITDITSSRNTRVTYNHYRYRFPTSGNDFRTSGNYILKIYRDSDENKVVMTRRFLVVEDLVNITPDVGFTTNTQERRQLQAVNFYLNSAYVNLNEPFSDLNVMVLQNFRWDSRHQHLKAAYIYPDRQEFRFDAANDFPGGNEYRYFDLRNIRRLGGRLRDIAYTDSGMFVQMEPDKPRTGKQYTTEPDFNGGFVIGVRQSDADDVEADYVYTQVLLATKEPVGDVYIFGQVSDWKPKPAFKMNYIDGGYERTVLLKQGVYNYHFVVWNPSMPRVDEELLEGSHFETENFYSILVYVKTPSDRAHRLVGLRHVNYYE